MKFSQIRCKSNLFQNTKQEPSFFNIQKRLCYCTDTKDLFNCLGLSCNPSNWRIFKYSCKRSLKAVILHNGNKYSRIHIGHSIHLKDSYDNLELLLEAIKYTTASVGFIGISKSLGSFWASKMDLQSIVFSVSGTVGLCLNTIYRKTGGLNLRCDWWWQCSSGGHEKPDFPSSSHQARYNDFFKNLKQKWHCLSTLVQFIPSIKFF